MAQTPGFATFQQQNLGTPVSFVNNEKPLAPCIERTSTNIDERERDLESPSGSQEISVNETVTRLVDPLKFFIDNRDGSKETDNFREKPTAPIFGSFVVKCDDDHGGEENDRGSSSGSQTNPNERANDRAGSEINNSRTELPSRDSTKQKVEFRGFDSSSDFPNPWRKPENINVYATKKTIAQGMLDVALLAANATQLKNLLVIGEAYQFYIFALTLVCLSIALQIISGLLSLSLNLMRDRKMEDARYSASIDWIGTARVALSFTVFLINIIITVLVGILFIILGSMDINRRRDQRAAIIINDIILIGIFLISLVNVIIAGFNIDYSYKPPKFSDTEKNGLILIVLGSVYNLNRQADQSRARLWNDISLAVMLLTVIINVVVASFALRDEP